MKRGLVLGILLLAGSLSVAVMGFQGPPAGQGQGGPPAGGPGAAPGGRGAPAPQALNTIKVRDNLYMIANAGGNTAVFIASVKVWPSASSFCRWLSMRWPKISWNNTPDARPERIAGPT